MCVTLRNAIYFHLHPARVLTHPVCTHALSALADTVLAVRSSMARDSMSAGNDMDREPGTGDGKPGTRDGASGTTGDGEPEPGTCDQGVPGTADGRARDGTLCTSAGNNMDCEPGIRDCAVQCTCVHARLLNKFTLV